MQVVTSDDLYLRALVFARSAQIHSVYDALYVVLAQLVNAELWTDDRRLLQAAANTVPWVRWIGDYPISQH
jgi:predicted nucleic acid-binding protein